MRKVVVTLLLILNFASPLTGKILSPSLNDTLVEKLQNQQKSSIVYYIHQTKKVLDVKGFCKNKIDSLTADHVVVIVFNPKLRELHVQLSSAMANILTVEKLRKIQESSVVYFAKQDYYQGLSLIINKIEQIMFNDSLEKTTKKENNHKSVWIILLIGLVLGMYFFISWLFFNYDNRVLNDFKLQISDLNHKLNSYQRDTIMQWAEVMSRRYRLQHFKWKAHLPLIVQYLNSLNIKIQELNEKGKYDYKQYVFKHYIVELIKNPKNTEDLHNKLQLFDISALQIREEWIKQRNAQILTQLELLSKDYKVKVFINKIKKEANEAIKYESLRKLTTSDGKITEITLNTQFEKTYSKIRSEMNETVEKIGQHLREKSWPDNMVKEYCKTIKSSASNKEEVKEILPKLEQILNSTLPAFSTVTEETQNWTIEQHLDNTNKQS